MSASSDLKNANKKLKELGSFKYDDSAGFKAQYDSAYSDYYDLIDNPQRYGYNAYISDVNELFEQVMNQPSFSYDPKTDRLFQLYKQQYQSSGSSAMKNRMGVASALSGGYNSSAAQTSAQGKYMDYMNALASKADEAYRSALETYRYNQQNLLDRWGAARDMNNAGNEAYFKQADISAQNLNSAYSAYNDDRGFQLGKYNNDRSFYQSQGKNAQDQINWLKEYKLQKKLLAK